MRNPVVRYAGVLNPLGRRLLNVCFETTEEQFELHKEAPVETCVQVPEEPEVYVDPAVIPLPEGS